MRRVMVPLDGTELAASILPDARRLAGVDGQLVLVRDAGPVRPGRDPHGYAGQSGAGEADQYLDRVAAALRAEGVAVTVHRLAASNIAHGIDVAARLLRVDMIACATHARGAVRRLVWGSVALDMLAHSPVPVLLRHPRESWDRSLGLIETHHPRILVPLDGSEFAESALPLAEELAREWNASIWLVQVVPDLLSYAPQDGVAKARAYLEAIADDVHGDVRFDVLTGRSIPTMLIRTVRDWSITDVVMASHGRSGLSRFILGSVAEALIQHLHRRIVVVPMLTVESMERAGQARSRDWVSGVP